MIKANYFHVITNYQNSELNSLLMQKINTTKDRLTSNRVMNFSLLGEHSVAQVFAVYSCLERCTCIAHSQAVHTCSSKGDAANTFFQAKFTAPKGVSYRRVLEHDGAFLLRWTCLLYNTDFRYVKDIDVY